MRFFDDLLKQPDEGFAMRCVRDVSTQASRLGTASETSGDFSPLKYSSKASGVRIASEAIIPLNSEGEEHIHSSHFSPSQNETLLNRQVENIRDAIQPWDPDIIEHALRSGRFVRIWSRTLDRWCVWVRDEGIKFSASRRFPETPVFTLEELKSLVETRCPSEHIKCISETRAIFGNECAIQLRRNKSERS